MFNFKTKPYAHQLKALEESWSADYHALFMEMGTGKSKVALDTISILYDRDWETYYIFQLTE